MPNLRKRSHKRVSHLTRSRALEDVRESVKVQKLSRKLYALPLELKVMIFQFAVISNMVNWSKKHAEKFQGILIAVNPKFLIHQEHRLFGHYSNYMEFYEYMREFNPDQFLEWVKPPQPETICEKCPIIRRKVIVPSRWVEERVSGERYDQLECRDWGYDGMCEYWHHPKCWCRDCYDVRKLSQDYQETMRHWFLKYQSLGAGWIAQCRDFSEGKDKRDLKLGFIDERQNHCRDTAPPEFWDYLDRNYTWSKNQWAYVPK